MKRIAEFKKVSTAQFKSDFKFENPDLAYDNIMLPRRATKGSAGYDFFSPVDFSLQAGESITIQTGIRVRIDDGYLLQIYPRSGLGFKYRIQLDNTVGIIDGDYYNSDNEGHIMIKITNDSKEGRTAEVKAGQGFAQGIFTEYAITIDDDCEEIRNGGFGSTTK